MEGIHLKRYYQIIYIKEYYNVPSTMTTGAVSCHDWIGELPEVPDPPLYTMV